MKENQDIHGIGFRASRESRFYPILTKLFYECCTAWQIRLLSAFSFRCPDHQVGSSAFKSSQTKPFHEFGKPSTNDVGEIRNTSVADSLNDDALMLSNS